MLLKTHLQAVLNRLGWGNLSTEQVMYRLTEGLNHGMDTSALEDFGAWFPAWLAANGASNLLSLNNTVWPGYSTIMDCIDRGHVAVGGFDNYASLRLADGSNPYKWTDPPGLGHVLLIVGYDTDQHTVVVHDPLRADPSGQPADYSWSGFQAAQFHDCTEVAAPALPYVIDTVEQMDPNFSIIDNQGTVQCVVAGHDFQVSGYLAHQMFGALARPDLFTLVYGLPTENQHHDADGIWRQGFEVGIAQVNNDDTGFKMTPLPAPDTSALQSELATAQSNLANEQQQVITLQVQVNQLKSSLAAVQATSPADAQIAALAVQFAAQVQALSVPVPASPASVTKPLPVAPSGGVA